MRLHFSKPARDDLFGIGDYILGHNPQAAAKLVAEIETRCFDLCDMPYVGAAYPGIANLRYLVHGNYLIFYSLHAAELRIERILHGARDIGSVL
jgi:toxin ParE1/3/4